MDTFVKRLQPERYQNWVSGRDFGSHPEEPGRTSAAPPPSQLDVLANKKMATQVPRSPISSLYSDFTDAPSIEVSMYDPTYKPKLFRAPPFRHPLPPRKRKVQCIRCMYSGHKCRKCRLTAAKIGDKPVEKAEAFRTKIMEQKDNLVKSNDETPAVVSPAATENSMPKKSKKGAEVMKESNNNVNKRNGNEAAAAQIPAEILKTKNNEKGDEAVKKTNENYRNENYTPAEEKDVSPSKAKKSKKTGSKQCVEAGRASEGFKPTRKLLRFLQGLDREDAQMCDQRLAMQEHETTNCALQADASLTKPPSKRKASEENIERGEVAVCLPEKRRILSQPNPKSTAINMEQITQKVKGWFRRCATPFPDIDVIDVSSCNDTVSVGDCNLILGCEADDVIGQRSECSQHTCSIISGNVLGTNDDWLIASPVAFNLDMQKSAAARELREGNISHSLLEAVDDLRYRTDDILAHPNVDGNNKNISPFVIRRRSKTVRSSDFQAEINEEDPFVSVETQVHSRNPDRFAPLRESSNRQETYCYAENENRDKSASRISNDRREELHAKTSEDATVTPDGCASAITVRTGQELSGVAKSARQGLHLKKGISKRTILQATSPKLNIAPPKAPKKSNLGNLSQSKNDETPVFHPQSPIINENSISKRSRQKVDKSCQNAHEVDPGDATREKASTAGKSDDDGDLAKSKALAESTEVVLNKTSANQLKRKQLKNNHVQRKICIGEEKKSSNQQMTAAVKETLAISNEVTENLLATQNKVVPEKHSKKKTQQPVRVYSDLSTIEAIINSVVSESNSQSATIAENTCADSDDISASVANNQQDAPESEGQIVNWLGEELGSLAALASGLRAKVEEHGAKTVAHSAELRCLMRLASRKLESYKEDMNCLLKLVLGTQVKMGD